MLFLKTWFISIILFKISTTKTLLTYLIIVLSWQVYSAANDLESFKKSNNTVSAQPNDGFINSSFNSSGVFSYSQDRLLNTETNWFENADDPDKPDQIFTDFLIISLFGFSFIQLILLFLFRILKPGFPEILFIKVKVLRI